MDDEVLDPVFKALADSTRRHLLDVIRRQEGVTLGDLCEDLAMARQSVTQHLDVLVKSGLVAVVRSGRERRHYLNATPIHEIERRWIRDFDRTHLHAMDTLRHRAERIAMEQNSPAFPAYVYVTYIQATAEQVWQALTDADITALYWNGMSNVSDWQPGSTWTHQVPDGEGRYDIWGKILEADPPRRLVFTFQPEAQPLGSPGSEVTYSIEPEGDVVRLTVTHAKVPDQGMFEGVSQAWPTVLSSLKSYLETGQPLTASSWALMAR